MNFVITCPSDIYHESIRIEKMPSGSRYRRANLKPENYIWDEDLSVRENKRKTEEYNDAVNKPAIRIEKERLAAFTELDNSITNYIVSEYDVSSSIAAAVWSWCKTYHDDSAHLYISDVMDLVRTVLEDA